VQSEVTQTPTCAECGDVWLPADRKRWRLRLGFDDELVWFCPECDEREVGGS
jgi:RNase P subunit RPR2